MFLSQIPYPFLLANPGWFSIVDFPPVARKISAYLAFGDKEQFFCLLGRVVQGDGSICFANTVRRELTNPGYLPALYAAGGSTELVSCLQIALKLTAKNTSPERFARLKLELVARCEVLVTKEGLKTKVVGDADTFQLERLRRLKQLHRAFDTKALRTPYRRIRIRG